MKDDKKTKEESGKLTGDTDKVKTQSIGQLASAGPAKGDPEEQKHREPDDIALL